MTYIVSLKDIAQQRVSESNALARRRLELLKHRTANRNHHEEAEHSRGMLNRRVPDSQSRGYSLDEPCFTVAGAHQRSITTTNGSEHSPQRSTERGIASWMSVIYGADSYRSKISSLNCLVSLESFDRSTGPGDPAWPHETEEDRVLSEQLHPAQQDSTLSFSRRSIRQFMVSPHPNGSTLPSSRNGWLIHFDRDRLFKSPTFHDHGLSLLTICLMWRPP